MTSATSTAEVFDYSFIEPIAQFVLERTKHRPKLGIVCGTGLGDLANAVSEQEVIPYSSIPNFPQSTVSGHMGNLIFGLLSGKPVVLMQGRFHVFEGYSAQQCTIPIRVMKLIGVKTLFLTNASGGLSPKLKVGDVLIIRDHINLPGLAGWNPLRGHNDDRFGPRFVPLSNAYDAGLIADAKDCAASLSLDVHEGVYAMQMGPAYESVAECRMLQMVGADVCGMSTCPEVLVARHCSMRVFAVSVVTNLVVLNYDSNDLADHGSVVEVGKRSGVIVQRLVEELVKRMTLE